MAQMVKKTLYLPEPIVHMLEEEESRMKVPKVRKTLYLPKWVAEMLDAEGRIYGGPGVIAAAAILSFCTAPRQKRVSALQEFRAAEIDRRAPKTKQLAAS